MILTPGERNSVIWQRLMQHFITRREELRAKLEGDLDSTKTAEMRGRLAELRALITLDKDVPVIEHE